MSATDFRGTSVVSGIRLEHGYLYVEERTEEPFDEPRYWLVLETATPSASGRQSTKIEVEKDEFSTIEEWMTRMEKVR